MSQFNTAIPTFVPSAAAIEKARNRRRCRRTFRDLAQGRWRRVLMDMKKSQHFFPGQLKSDGTFGSLLTKFNVFSVAIDIHATTLAANQVKISVPEEYQEQALAITQIRNRCLFDARLHAAVRLFNRESEAYFAVSAIASGVIISLESNERTFAVGPDGPDGQPTVIDRRWIIEQPDPVNHRQKRHFLRIERHSAGRIEQLAYLAKGDDVLQDETQLSRVPLTDAIGTQAAASVQELVETGLEHPALTRLIAAEDDHEPAFIINEEDIDLFDTLAASFTRLARTSEQHGDPKIRVAEEHIDKSTGQLTQNRALLDPDKEVEYIIADFKLDKLLAMMSATLDYALIVLHVSKGLIGLKEGAAAEAYESKLLDSSLTLSRAIGAQTYVQPALNRIWSSACTMESRLPARGFPVAPVDVQMRPGIPKSPKEVIRELRDQLDAGIISQRRAIATLHGDDQVDDILAEIAEEQDAKAAREAKSFSASFGPSLSTGNPVVDDANAVGGGVA